MIPIDEKSRRIRKCGRRKIDGCQTFGRNNASALVSSRHDSIYGRGDKIPHEEYLKEHADLLRRDEWIIDGFGCVASAWERFSKADTLVYIDLPLIMHHWWVTKRLIKGLFATPEGWPKNSPMWSSTIDSYMVLWLCHRRLTPRYRQLVAEVAAFKRVHHLKSRGEINAFLNAIKREHASPRPVRS